MIEDPMDIQQWHCKNWKYTHKKEEGEIPIIKKPKTKIKKNQFGGKMMPNLYLFENALIASKALMYWDWWRIIELWDLR
jgi:hypothetical protein